MGRKLLGEKGKVFEARDIYVETYNIAIRQKFALEHPDLVEKFLKALLKAERYIMDNPADAITKVADYTGMERGKLQEIWGDFNFEVVLEQSLIQYLQKEAEWAQQVGTAPPDKPIPNFDLLLYPSPLKKLKPEGVNLP